MQKCYFMSCFCFGDRIGDQLMKKTLIESRKNII
uniref:Uncharacterized protein n=1 Tax=Rhizophora mucronata TaxID=61149 RepID=A0A2P2JMQ4_RHIMU